MRKLLDMRCWSLNKSPTQKVQLFELKQNYENIFNFNLQRGARLFSGRCSKGQTKETGTEKQAASGDAACAPGGCTEEDND
jgi:hypothetical protein